MERKKKCPLIASEKMGEYGMKRAQADCMQEECAWWDGKTSQCAVLVIAQKGRKRKRNYDEKPEGWFDLSEHFNNAD